MKFPWVILSILSIAALAFGLLLGMKSVRITETEIIDFYADDFVRKMNKKGVSIDRSACYAKVSESFWERMIVVCDIDASSFLEYPIGAWGQLLVEAPFVSLREGI
tara:strand:- start:292 stop:609 length:318 start_codon:yes stop_codon:yes gene_type:complete